MDNITRTVYGNYVQSCLYMGLPIQYFENTTLNEKLDINKSLKPAGNEKPVLGYFAIGNKGHKAAVGADGIAKPDPVPHAADDSALYGQLPFVLRPVNNDLTTTERARYALRRVEQHNGVQYAAYYLKRIDLGQVVPQMLYKVVANGNETTTPFTPTAANLNPTPPNVDGSGQWIVSGDYVIAKAVLELSMTANDANELANVARILYGDDGYAIISEIALCHGVDKIVNVSAGNSSFNMLEAIGVQIASHIPSFYSMKFSSEGVRISMNVGASEPMWNIVLAN